VRGTCWALLKDLEAYDAIPSPWNQKYRVDPYGNVVSLKGAARNSVTGFQVDHVFAWSRGGLTVPGNLMACHWYANMHVKGDALLDANECAGVAGRPLAERMAVGLSVEQLLGLIQLRGKLGGRAQQRSFDDLLDALLCSAYALPWPTGGEVAPLRNVQPGEQTLQFLQDAWQKSQADLMTWVLVKPPGQVGAGSGDEGASGAESDGSDQEAALAQSS